MATAATKWHPQAYGSGTHIVTDDTAGPWLYVVIVNPVGDDEAQRQRWHICEQLAAYLNGGIRPAWLADMDYDGGDKMVGADGLEIEACGPLYDANPPHLDWRRREDEEAKAARAWLMFQLHR